MGTMRNNFTTVFVLLALMLSVGRSHPRGYDNTSKGNNFVDPSTGDDARSTSYPIYKCLYIDPDLPTCDVERMLNSDEKTTEPPRDPHPRQDFATRSRRNVDAPVTSRVVVYTIEGCLPSTLPFSLPSCHGIALDKIVDVQRFRPFVVEGVTQSPFVFPEFNYARWLRMMTRLRSRISSKAQDERRNNSLKETSYDESPHDRTSQPMNAATRKQAMPDAIAASDSIWKGPPANEHILRLEKSPAKSRKSMKKYHGSKAERQSLSQVETMERNESTGSSASNSRKSVDYKPEVNSGLAVDRSNDWESLSKDLRDDSRTRITGNIETPGDGAWRWNDDRDLAAIPAIPTSSIDERQRSVYELSQLDDLGIAVDSRRFLNNEIADDLDDLTSSEVRQFGRARREIRVSGGGSIQGISDESKTRGIAGKSYSLGVQSSRESYGTETSTDSSVSSQWREDAATRQRGVASTTTTPRTSAEDQGKGSKSSFASSRFKIDLASMKAAWRKGLEKDAALGKKHRTYTDLSTSRSQ